MLKLLGVVAQIFLLIAKNLLRRATPEERFRGAAREAAKDVRGFGKAIAHRDIDFVRGELSCLRNRLRERNNRRKRREQDRAD